MTNSRPGAGFAPPPLDDVSRRRMGIYSGWTEQAPAEGLVSRFRAAGILARVEQYPGIGPHGPGHPVFQVRVAYAHLICAGIVWALGRKSPEDWLRMPVPERASIARKALLQLALSGEDWRIDRYPRVSLEWLRSRLGMTDAQFRTFLAEAEKAFRAKVLRDRILAPVLTAASLFTGYMGGALYWGAHGWQSIACYVLAGVFGLFWLSKEMLRVGERARRRAAIPLGAGNGLTYDGIVELAQRSLYAAHRRGAVWALVAAGMFIAGGVAGAVMRWGLVSWQAVLLYLPGLAFVAAALWLRSKAGEDLARLNIIEHSARGSGGRPPGGPSVIDISRDKAMEFVLQAVTGADAAWRAGDIGSASGLFAEAAALAGSVSNPNAALFEYCARIGLVRTYVARDRDADAAAVLEGIDESWKGCEDFMALAQELNERASDMAEDDLVEQAPVDLSRARVTHREGLTPSMAVMTEPAQSGQGRSQAMEFPPVNDNPYETMGRYIVKARQLLASGDAKGAYAVLERLVEIDRRSVCSGYPEYYETRLECEKRLGLDTRNSRNQIEELKLNWMAAFDKGTKLLEARKYAESIAYFQRSINDNPGEAGTQGTLEGAYLGLARAFKALGRDREAEACLKEVAKG